MLKLVLAPADRAVLHQRIEKRFDLMLEHGFLDEVGRLRALPQMRQVAAPLDLPAVRAVGYRQAWQYLDGQGSASEFRDKGIFATRQLAKRQMTWLRAMPQRHVLTIDAEATSATLGAQVLSRLPEGAFSRA